MVHHPPDPNYLSTQYHDSANINARAQLHIRFGAHKQAWQCWVFDRLQLPSGVRLLEVGCGPGWLWSRNKARVRRDWHVTLSDISPGMLHETQLTLRDAPPVFAFEIIDARQIPYRDGSFDVVIANHMLYTVPDLPRALAEIRRVLAPDGTFYATTNGESHMRTLFELVARFDPDVPQWESHIQMDSFTLENGQEQLTAHFADVRLTRYEDALIVTEIEPLVDYVRSGPARDYLVGERLAAFRAFLEAEMAPTGAILLGKDVGLFTARGPKPDQ
ncbi:MAG: methyltransferase domain-containing protein [Chloroflexi bacterium]|nr:methyltransferase domain-containing protein [Chloroflexota bacterium]